MTRRMAVKAVVSSVATRMRWRLEIVSDVSAGNACATWAIGCAFWLPFTSSTVLSSDIIAIDDFRRYLRPGLLLFVESKIAFNA